MSSLYSFMQLLPATLLLVPCPDGVCNLNGTYNGMKPGMVKPGMCPPVVDYGTCVALCTNDAWCADDLKCCSNGCGRTCQEPIDPTDGDCSDVECPQGTVCEVQGDSVACVDEQPKPGTCPPVLSFGTCVNACTNDASCDDELKCCSNGCGRTCQMPPDLPDCNGIECPEGTRCEIIYDVVACVDADPRPGTCPPVVGFGTCQRMCSVDAMCEEGLKCCSNGCGRECQVPDRNCDELECGLGTRCKMIGNTAECVDEPPKPGTCPPVEVFGPCIEMCSNDAFCGDNLKCCFNGCGHTCERPPEAPDCADVECPAGMVCEIIGGSAGCVDEEPKPGSCPAVVAIGSCANKCSVDEDCDEERKCCSNGCGRECEMPVDEPEPEDCSSVQCPAGTTCEIVDDDVQCVDEEPKPGLCPPFFEISTCLEVCSNDQSCDADLKCCSNGCGRECQKPPDRPICLSYNCPIGQLCGALGDTIGCLDAQPKPGTCPPVTALGTCEAQCSIDFFCPGESKCCPNGCGRECQRPVELPNCDGTRCPEGQICELTPTDVQCVDEPPKPTCSSTLCPVGLRCVDTDDGAICYQIEKPGTCPSQSNRPCREDSPVDECADDSFCPAQEKCCSGPCALECQEPDPEPECLDITCPEGTFCEPDASGGSVCVKPGICPPIVGYGLCVAVCSDDASCNGELKCCSNGCGQSCQEPLQPPNTASCSEYNCPVGTVCEQLGDTVGCVDAMPKPGECPAVTVTGECGNICFVDNSCEGELKCCPNGCGRECQEPVDMPNGGSCSELECPPDMRCVVRDGTAQCIAGQPKPGFCPEPMGIGSCVEMCSDDESCNNDLKCCSNGCGNACQEPMRPNETCSELECPPDMRCIVAGRRARCVPGLGKPGLCPEPMGINSCVAMCSDDDSCNNDLKCCSNGCGNACQEPMGVSQTCSEVECPPDMRCVVRGRTPQCVPGQPKAGRCPVPMGIGSCVAECADDDSCNNDLKCCSNGCGNACQNPSQLNASQSRFCQSERCQQGTYCEDDGNDGGLCVRPGTCPPPSGSLGICVFDESINCISDLDCLPNEKCCAEDCNRVCKQVQEPNCLAINCERAGLTCVMVSNELLNTGPQAMCALDNLCPALCPSELDCEHTNPSCTLGSSACTPTVGCIVDLDPCSPNPCPNNIQCTVEELFPPQVSCDGGFSTCEEAGCLQQGLACVGVPIPNSAETTSVICIDNGLASNPCEIENACSAYHECGFATPACLESDPIECFPMVFCFPSISPPQDCSSVTCRGNQECTVIIVTCVTAPCVAEPVCVDRNPTCQTTQCPSGEVCELVPVNCVVPPCPSQARCVPA